MSNPLESLTEEQYRAILSIITAQPNGAQVHTIAQAVVDAVTAARTRQCTINELAARASVTLAPTTAMSDIRAIVELAYDELHTPTEQPVDPQPTTVYTAQLNVASSLQQVVEAQEALADAQARAQDELTELDKQLGFTTDDSDETEYPTEYKIPEYLGYNHEYPLPEPPAVHYDGRNEPEQLVTDISDPSQLQALAVEDATQVLEIDPETAAILRSEPGPAPFTGYQDEVLDRTEQPMTKSSPTFGIDRTPWTQPGSN